MTAEQIAAMNGMHAALEDRRRELVTALALPPETAWADALARVVPAPAVPVEPVGAKGCHGCRLVDGDGVTCSAADGASTTPTAQQMAIRVWILDHLSDDMMTPKPNAPECPGRTERP